MTQYQYQGKKTHGFTIGFLQFREPIPNPGMLANYENDKVRNPSPRQIREENLWL